MNILNLLTKEKHIAGIEISDSVIRIAFFRNEQKKKGEQEEKLILIEETIPPNIIKDGIVADIDALGKTLASIWMKAKLDTSYAIVSIPDNQIYSKIFSFPKSVTNTHLTEAMRLAVDFQLPVETKDIYLDWERTEGTPTTNEILLSMTPQTVASGYIDALEKAGIKTIALESHLAAFARAIKLKQNTVTLFLKKNPDGATIFALKNGILKFSRTLPSLFVPEDQVANEIENVKTALSSETAETIEEQDFNTALPRDEYSKNEISEPQSKWLIALGAAIRGNIPEGEDNLISLLPVGTEEAYAYQRTTAFIVLMRNLVVGVSIFFVATYLIAYLFIVSLSQNASKQIATFSSTAISESSEDEERILTLNAVTETGMSLLAQTPTWSTVLDEITLRTPDEITITMLAAPGFTEKITLSGTAETRNALNNYKKSLQESPLFTEIDLPLTNLGEKRDIPFALSFYLKDPNALYYLNNQTN